MNQIGMNLLLSPSSSFTATKEEDAPEPISRRGYALKDLARSFIQALSESNSVATGRAFHYTADMVGSGGLELWQHLCWDYAFDHIGISSLRVFVYLRKKFAELSEKNRQMPFQLFVAAPQVQQATAETVIILQMAPKKSKVKVPQVPPETHLNDTWFDTATTATMRASVERVWSRGQDTPILLHATNQLIHHIVEGALERALFWLRWIQEEDAAMRKKFGTGLSTNERGPLTLQNTKQRTHPGFFLCSVFAETYKELAATGSVRLHEEFQTLLDLYRNPPKGITAMRRQDILILMTQILTEVPRWKIPAAPELIRDAIVMQRAIAQIEPFYKEIIALPLPPRPLPGRVGGLTQRKKITNTREEDLNKHLTTLDTVIMNYYGRS